MGYFSIFGYIGGLLGGLLSIKFLIINHYKLNDSVGTLLYKKILSDNSYRFIFEEEMIFDNKQPKLFKAFIKMDNIFFIIDKSERLLTAGWNPKEEVIDLYFFRWNTNKIKNLLNTINNIEKEVSIYAVMPYDNIYIGKLDCSNYNISLDTENYIDIEEDIIRCLSGDIDKTSALLYGRPGNGKSRFIKYIAQKYELPIYSFYFNPEYTNIDILKSFSNIPSRSIILLEDFDNYFNDRECIMKSENIKFTFDVFLSSLDGVYNQYKEMIFFMTVNDITKVSDALTKRPSRFKYVREFKNPSVKLKLDILGDEYIANNIGDISLDQTFKIKDFISVNDKITIEEAKKLIN